MEAVSLVPAATLLDEACATDNEAASLRHHTLCFPISFMSPLLVTSISTASNNAHSAKAPREVTIRSVIGLRAVMDPYHTLEAIIFTGPETRDAIVVLRIQGRIVWNNEAVGSFLYLSLCGDHPLVAV